MMDLIESIADKEISCFASGVYRFQVSMIGKIDDCSKFSCDNLNDNFQHKDYSVLTRLCWSKNIRTEQDTPQ